MAEVRYDLRFEIYSPNEIRYHVCLECFGPFLEICERDERMKDNSPLL